MVEAVILSEEIIAQARFWRDECLSRWKTNGEQIGQATLVSPVDKKLRTVILLLGQGCREKALTLRGRYTLNGNFLGDDGYTIALNTNHCPNLLKATLLHELTHTIDPYFDEDVHRQNAEGAVMVPIARYNLLSEQRAFTAMWIDNLWEDLVNGRFHDAPRSVNLYRALSPEFNGFCQHAPQLTEQIHTHFRRMIVELKSRQS